MTVDSVFVDRWFAAGTNVFSAFYMGDIRARYGYELLPESNFSVQVGGGLTYIDTTIDLAPAIIVNGDVGIVHYLYSSASKDADGKVETSNGRYTDILLRTDDGWKFIAWHGGDDE